MLQDKEQALGYYAPSSDTCHTGSVLPSRAVGVCPPLHKTPVFMGPSHSSGLAAKGQTIPPAHIMTPADVSQQHPYHSPPTPFLSSVSFYEAPLPTSARRLTPPPYSLHSHCLLFSLLC